MVQISELLEYYGVIQLLCSSSFQFDNNATFTLSPPAFACTWWVHIAACWACFPFLFCFIDCISQSCTLFISTSKHQVAACVSVNFTFSLVAVPTLTSSSHIFFPYIHFLSFYCHTLIDSTAPSLSSHPALHLLSLLPFLAPSSLPLIQSRSSTSQIDFTAVLRSPINSQIGFPAYPLPLALHIFFLSLSLLHPLFSLIPVSFLLAFGVSSVLLSLSTLSFSHTFPLFLSLYTHSYLSATAEVS